jgi:hypothetical protein
MNDHHEMIPDLSQKLSEKEIALREKFISEYMVDFDAFQACLRMGFMPSFAVEWSKRLFQDPYVQRGIAKLMRSDPSRDPKEQEAQDRALVENTLREGMQRGPYSSRNAATRLFMEMKGWVKPDGADTEKVLVDVLKEIATKVPV